MVDIPDRSGPTVLESRSTGNMFDAQACTQHIRWIRLSPRGRRDGSRKPPESRTTQEDHERYRRLC